jgi:hypothetical protein
MREAFIILAAALKTLYSWTLVAFTWFPFIILATLTIHAQIPNKYHRSPQIPIYSHECSLIPTSSP